MASMLPCLAMVVSLVVVLGDQSLRGAGTEELEIIEITTSQIQPSPPVFASRFHMSFVEASRMFKPFGKLDLNNGSYHYDYDSGRQLWSHGKGQSNNWCQCAGLQTNEQCDLLSLGSSAGSGGSLHAVFKTMVPPRCCTIGDWAHGFGPLRPDWMLRNNATFVGQKTVGNKTCFEWAVFKPGDWFTMISDNWSVDSKGMPCEYEDKFKAMARWLGMHHTLTFDAASYGTDHEPDEVFMLPDGMDCEEKCPNKQGWCGTR